MTTPAYLDKKNEARSTLREVEYGLVGLASAFRATGNEKVAEMLTEASYKISDGTQLYESAWAELFDDSIRATQQATTNMVQAALNVATRKCSNTLTDVPELSLSLLVNGMTVITRNGNTYKVISDLTSCETYLLDKSYEFASSPGLEDYEEDLTNTFDNDFDIITVKSKEGNLLYKEK